MRTLVLGGSVFVGRRLVEALVAGDHEVTVLNRGRTPTALPDGVKHLAADRTDPEQLAAVLAGTSWDVVYDVSGFVMVAGGADIEVLLDLLDGSVGHYVYVSSVMAYDQALLGIFPWTERLPTNPGGPRGYGGFKAMTERALLDRRSLTGFPASIVRPAAIYGPCNNIYDMETPMFLRLLQGRPILVPHHGLVAGSYGHVDDLCELMVAMSGREVAYGEVYNVTAEAVTARRYVATLADIVGTEADIVEIPDHELAHIEEPVYSHLFAEQHHAVLSTAKAEHDLGYRPRYDFRTGHVNTYEWFLAQGWAELDGVLADPLWQSSWDFDAEAAVARRCR